MREQLRNIYLDYLNNYLTVEVFAEKNGLWVDEATDLIKLCKRVFEENHPEA